MVRKNIKPLSMILLVVLLIFGMEKWVSRSPQLLRNQYMYYAGSTILSDAVFVDLGNEGWYIASASVADSCADPAWRERKDVYRYILGTSKNYARDAVLQELYDPSFRLYDYQYNPFTFSPYRIIGDSIFLYKFHYDIERFDMYLVAQNLIYYSPRNDDNEDAFSYDKNYDIALRAHFSLLQILKLRREWRLQQSAEEK